jgi:hypothetical protein
MLVSLVLGISAAQASTKLGPWVPIFKGIDHAVGTNTPGNGGFPERQVVNAMRIELTDADIKLFASPRFTNYSVDWYETAGFTTTNFLKNNGLQVAINANYFHDPGSNDTESPSYTKREGSPFDIVGLLISQGVVVAPQDDPIYPASFLFTTNNQATFIATNWPPGSTDGIFTAVTGLYTVLANGVNIGSNYINDPGFAHALNPRTAFGLSQDRRYLFLVTIDGRQGGYSDGAYDWETAAWLLRLGAYDGANMDGGGSTCMVMQDSTGRAVEVNHDSAAADPNTGRERTVGCHLGVWAKPLIGFINDVEAVPDDTAATITWTTIAPATTQVSYGQTPGYGSITPISTALLTNHAVLLTGLTPGTDYYFQVLSTASGGLQFASSNFFFSTINYAATNLIFDLTNSWRYTTDNLDGISWQPQAYDDSAWLGEGPGLLWTDNRGPNPDIPLLNTEMPQDPDTGNPYFTYYLRTHFNLADPSAATSLIFHDFCDDGAVFYLNGVEIFRLRMPPAPTPIYNATLADGYPCTGNADCPDDFVVSGDAVTNLVSGDNVLAVEVHNYDPGSPDITFGTSLAYTVPNASAPQLSISQSGGVIILSWNRTGFILQQTELIGGSWVDVPGPVFVSPYTKTNTGAAQYFRLRR